MRVDGVEHGVSVLPPFVVSAEDGAPEADAGPTLEVWPNPARGRASIELRLAEPESVAVEVVDVLGRVVYRSARSAYGSGEHTMPLNVAGLGSGVYVVRVVLASGSGGVRVLTQKVTLVE